MRFFEILLIAAMVVSCSPLTPTVAKDAMTPPATTKFEPLPHVDVAGIDRAGASQQAQGNRLDGWPMPGTMWPGRLQGTHFLADAVLVFKHERRLYLMQAGRPVAAYDVALGFSPKGHKRREGDGRTPEGLYWITGKNPNSDYHLSLHISYPNAQDVAAAQARGVPPGGNIVIHGQPNLDVRKVRAYHPYWDWTFGCIAVRDDEIREIYAAVSPGTPIQIFP